MKKKVLIVATVFGFIASFEKNNILLLQKQGYEVHVATNMNTEIHGAFGDTGQLEGIEVIKHQIDFMRSPLSMKNFNAYQQLKTLFKENHFDIVHCHTPVGGVITRLIANKSRNKGTRVIYTAHGFHFFNGGSKLNWFIYYPIEKIFSKYTDVLITINKEDYQLAKQKFRSQKTEYIPGVGVDVEKFAKITCNVQQKKYDLNIKEHEIVLLSVGELNKNKNHEVIIRAIKSLGKPQLRYIIAGKGEVDQYLQTLIKELNLTEQVQLLGYRTDIHELCQICDVFCFPSYREGLGLAAVEALSAGKPLITSTTRGVDDYSIDGVTGFKSKDYSIDGFVQAIQNYLDNRNNFDTKLLKKQAERFSKEEVQKIMKQIYMEII